MLRIKDPAVTVPFYVNNFGFRLIHKYDFAQWNFSLYFLAILPEGEEVPEPGTPESEQYLWNFKGVTLELTHNYGSETDPEFKVNNGNVEPHRGFGHIAVMTRDVYAASAELEAAGVRFQKRPDEGRMKGIAFALCPDGYWIEIVSRSEKSPVQLKYTLAQTMIRVKDPVPVLRFYRDLFGMTLLRKAHFSDFSLYFLASLSPQEKEQWAALCAAHEQQDDITTTPAASEFIRTMFSPVLELTHNHGTESNPDFKYHNGNDQDAGQVRGFGHVGFLCDDLDRACEDLVQQGVKFKKLPSEGSMRGLAFAYQPEDNYWVEIIQRGMKI
jgi:lactoylglutathione lyase